MYKRNYSLIGLILWKRSFEISSFIENVANDIKLYAMDKYCVLQLIKNDTVYILGSSSYNPLMPTVATWVQL